MLTVKGPVFWPDPDDVWLEFSDSASNWGVTEETIRAALATDVSKLLILEPNPSPDADSEYGTCSTLAALVVGQNHKLEIGLRQDLSVEWQEFCDALGLEVPGCLVFHAMYKPI